jgi:hypothetical protein
MMKFRFRASEPPCGYSYRVIPTGDELLAGSLAAVVNQARVVYTRNKLTPPADLAAQIEHSICLRSPGFCSGTREPGDEASMNLSVTGVKESAARMKKIRLKWPPGRFLASPVLAEQRAAVCVACPYNHVGFCTTCHGLKGFAEEVVGDRRTSLDGKLGVCAVCSCISKTKIHVSAEALKAHRRPKEEGTYPSACWLCQEGIVDP